MSSGQPCCQRDVDRDDEEAGQPDAAERGGGEHLRLVPLRGAQQCPRPAETLPGPDRLDRDPDRGQHQRRAQQPRQRWPAGEHAPNGPPPRQPQQSHEECDQHERRPDRRPQPVAGRSDVPGPRPPATQCCLPRRGRGANQQEQGNQGDPGEPPQARLREREQRQRPARERGDPAQPAVPAIFSSDRCAGGERPDPEHPREQQPAEGERGSERPEQRPDVGGVPQRNHQQPGEHEGHVVDHVVDGEHPAPDLVRRGPPDERVDEHLQQLERERRDP